jgi:hypothetical protein
MTKIQIVRVDPNAWHCDPNAWHWYGLEYTRPTHGMFCNGEVPVLASLNVPDGLSVNEVLNDWCRTVGVAEYGVYVAVADGHVIAAESGGRPLEAFVVLRGPDAEARICWAGRTAGDTLILWYPTLDAAEAALNDYARRIATPALSAVRSPEKLERAIASLNLRVVPSCYSWALESMRFAETETAARVVNGFAVPLP